jgi:hypothetical protein
VVMPLHADAAAFAGPWPARVCRPRHQGIIVPPAD